MVLSIRSKPIHAHLRNLLLEQQSDIAEQRTVQVASRPQKKETDKLPPLAFYHVESPYPLMKVVGGIGQWMRHNNTPPRFVGLSPVMLDEYWGGINWREIGLSLYYHRLADGSLWTIELGPMGIPDSVVYCSAKRP